MARPSRPEGKFVALACPAPLALSARLALLALCALAGIGCGDDPATAACTAGERSDCQCPSGSQGSQVCLTDGSPSRCDCRALRTVPCSAPGVAFDCACADGLEGVEICLADGRYTGCDCQAGSVTPPPVDAGAPTVPPTPPANATCPAGFSCVEQMGVPVCSDGSGFPPLCQSASDCAAAGLPTASCVDPMIGGVLICAQPCTP